MARTRSDEYLAELARIEGLAAAAAVANARLYAAIGAAREKTTGRPVLTWDDMAVAAGVPASTLQTRHDAHVRELAERAA